MTEGVPGATASVFSSHPEVVGASVAFGVFLMGVLIKRLSRTEWKWEDFCNAPDTCLSAAVGGVLFILDATSAERERLTYFLLFALLMLFVTTAIQQSFLHLVDHEGPGSGGRPPKPAAIASAAAATKKRRLARRILVSMNLLGLAVLWLLIYIKSGRR